MVSYLLRYYCICLYSGWVYLCCYCCCITSYARFPVEVVVVLGSTVCIHFVVASLESEVVVLCIPCSVGSGVLTGSASINYNSDTSPPTVA
jgi:hypothetical protein